MKASIIIPTYNRAEFLTLSLKSLCNQTISKNEYEVIISDDGSKDHTKSIVDEYSNLINLKYIFQTDEGYRVALARNNAIKAATGNILIFIDSGIICSTKFVQSHIDKHFNKKNLVVIGYVYGFDHSFELHNIPEYTDFQNPDNTIFLYEKNKQFLDVRERVYSTIKYDLSKLTLPWVFFWTANVSVRKSDMIKIGCFCEDFKTWGVEDIECAYRFYKEGFKFELSKSASVIHYPHERQNDSNDSNNNLNKNFLFKLHSCIETELYSVSSVYIFNKEFKKFKNLQGNNKILFSKFFKGKDFNKIAQILKPYKHIIFGCQDGKLIKYCNTKIALEFDKKFYNEAITLYPDVNIINCLGVNTLLNSKSFQAVLIAGSGINLTKFYFDKLINEARRIGKIVFLITDNLYKLDIEYEKISNLSNSYAIIKLK
jgi:glycosyltransferase involved in cell wall biosynthesis